MANYLTAYKRTGIAEGGFQAMPSDVGNYCRNRTLVGTHKGISAATFEEKKGYCPSKDQLINEANTNGHLFFKWYYWDKVSGDGIASQAVAESLSDWAFHKPAHVEAWMRRLGFWNNPAAVNQRSEPALLYAIALARWTYLKPMIDDAPQFRDGWERRIAAYSAPGLTLASVPASLVAAWRRVWYKGNPPGVPNKDFGLGDAFGLFAVGAIGYGAWKFRKRLRGLLKQIV